MIVGIRAPRGPELAPTAESSWILPRFVAVEPSARRLTAKDKTLTELRNAREIERQPGSCDRPETCTPLEVDFADYTKKCR